MSQPFLKQALQGSLWSELFFQQRIFMLQQKKSVMKSKPSAVNSKSTFPLVVIGTVAIDAVESPFGKRDRVFGGSASYFSYAASFFTPVALVAVVGKDFPKDYRAILEERSIDLSHLETKEGKTF